MMVSTSSKNIVSYQGSTTSTKRVNISDLTRSELIGKIQTQDFKKEDVAEIIKSINKLKISIDDIKMSEEKTVEIFKSNNYTPVYKSQEAEPKKINGIGNSNSYNSWRIER